MVSHHVCHILYGDFACRLYEQRKSLGLVVSHRIVDIVVCVTGDHGAVLVLESELAVAEDVECRPCPCLAASHAAEIKGSICVAEAEIFVLAAEIAHLAGK